MPGLGFFIGWFLRIAGAIDTVYALLKILGVQIGSPAQEPTLAEALKVERDNNGILVQLSDSDKLILTALSNIQNRLLAAIANTQQATKPVVLPTTPPPGYGGGGPSLTAAQVWEYQYPPRSGNIMGDQVNDAAFGAQQLGALSRMPDPYSQYLDHHFDYSSEAAAPITTPPALLDPHTILATDASIVDWLNRAYPAVTWGLLNNLPITYNNTVGGDDWWICNMTVAEFEWWKSRGGGTTVRVPPVWPGLGHVTLGAAVPIAAQVNLAGPMDGVIIDITSIAPRFTTYVTGGMISHRNIGACTFVDDNGQAESIQYLSFEQAVYVPRAMAHAARFIMQTQAALEGTITPWQAS